MYDELVAKVNSIDTSTFVLKNKYYTDKSELKTKISDTSRLLKKTDYYTKVTETEGKIPDVSNLTTKTAVTTVENKIPSVSNLIKKTDYNTKITEIENKLNNHNHDKYIDASEFNTLATYFFNARLAQNKSKHLLDENELNKLKPFDSNYFIGKSHFEEDGTQYYLLFQPIIRCFKLNGTTLYILSWQSKGLYFESIKPPTTSDNNLTPALNCYGTKTRVKCTGSCLKQSKISYTHQK